MPIQFNSNFPAPVGVPAASLPSEAPRAALIMAPVGLTPLAPPASASASVSPALAGDAGLAPETRQTRFAERQKALLDRLHQRNAAATPPAGNPLSEAQRQTCVSVLATVVAAVAHAEGEGR